ncbi:MAG: M56 family metallopeptidase [Gemmatimonadaceae bacterium]
MPPALVVVGHPMKIAGAVTGPLSTGQLLAWISTSLEIGVVLLLAALALQVAARAASRPTRWIWLAAIVAIVGVSVALPFRLPTWPPASAFVMLRTPATLPQLGETASISLWWQVYGASLASMNSLFALVATAVAQLPKALLRPLPAIFLGAWALASLLTLTVLVTSYRRMRRLVADSPMGVMFGTAVHIADRMGPAVVGLLRPGIVIPAWLMERSVDERRLVITHEREHLMAGDPWLLIIGCAAIVLFPWNPVLWIALNRLRLAIETDCDQRVLARGIATATYGALLIDLSARTDRDRSATYPLTAFAHRGSFLERRLRTMTARRPRFRRTRILAGTLVATAAVLAACEAKLPTAAEVAALDVQGMERRTATVIDPRGRDTTAVIYIVDGKPMSGTVAKAIAADSIAELRVSKAGGDSSVIRVTTVKGAKGANLAPKTVVGVKITPNGTGTPSAEFTGLYLVDGVVSDAATMKSLSPDRIASVSVLKGPAATTKYKDPRAANGVIEITTKKP